MRLLTYNIHKGIGGRDRRYRLQRIIDVIREAEPDIVCLQEVDQGVKRSEFDDQPAILARELGLNHTAFQINHQIKSGGYGNCTLSKFPILEQHNIELRIKNRKNRRTLLTLIDTPEGRLNLTNWHLGLAERDRQKQVVMLLDHREFKKNDELPTIIAGDSNDWRNTLHRPSLQEKGYESLALCKSFPAYMPLGALDKAYANAQINLLHGCAISTKLTRAASDHLPVLIDFSVNS